MKTHITLFVFFILCFSVKSQTLKPYYAANHKFGYKNEKGEVVVQPKYHYAFVFNEGLAPVALEFKKWGFIDSTGKESIPCKYESATSFVNGLAIVQLGGKLEGPVWKDGKCGAIDKTGKFIIPQKYDGIGTFNEGLAYVLINEKYGFMDISEKIMIPCKYGFVSGFSDGYALVSLDKIQPNTTPKFEYIDHSGNAIPGLKYEICRSFKHGMAVVGNYVSDYYYYGFIDTTGKEIIPLKYIHVSDFDDEGKAKVFISDTDWYYINKKGEKTE